MVLFIFILGVLVLWFIWWVSSDNPPSNSQHYKSSNQTHRHHIGRYNKANQYKQAEANRLRELQEAKRKAEAWEKEAKIKAEQKATQEAFEAYLKKQDELAVEALEKKLAAEGEEKQKHILEQTERLKQETEAEKRRQEKERAKERLKAEFIAGAKRLAATQENQLRQADERAELELCETDTDYYYALEGVYNRNTYGFSSSAIKSLSYDCGVFNELESGIAQLNTPEQLIQYIYSYGNMHRAKLLQAFESLVSNRELDLYGQDIEIIDYGCGQGIGTIVFIDFLKSYPQFNYSVRRVRLIEPSILALKRAALHARYSLRSANQPQVVHAINKELDDLTVDNLKCDTNTIKFHIFSNILDVEAFNLTGLYDRIVDNASGINYFICVSPNIFSDGSHPRNQRLVRFREYFQNSYNTTLLSRRTCSIQSYGNKPWTRFEKVFKVDFDEEVTTTTNSNTAYVFDEPDDLPF